MLKGSPRWSRKCLITLFMKYNMKIITGPVLNDRNSRLLICSLVPMMFILKKHSFFVHEQDRDKYSPRKKTSNAHASVSRSHQKARRRRDCITLKKKSALISGILWAGVGDDECWHRERVRERDERQRGTDVSSLHRWDTGYTFRGRQLFRDFLSPSLPPSCSFDHVWAQRKRWAWQLGETPESRTLCAENTMRTRRSFTAVPFPLFIVHNRLSIKLFSGPRKMNLLGLQAGRL